MMRCSSGDRACCSPLLVVTAGRAARSGAAAAAAGDARRRLDRAVRRRDAVRLADRRATRSGESTDGTVATNGDKPGWLMTTTEWGDFELHVEFKAPAATNSGIFFRIGTRTDRSDEGLHRAEHRAARTIRFQPAAWSGDAK